MLAKSSNFSLLTASIYHMKYLPSVSRENNHRCCTLAQLGKDGVNGPIAQQHAAKGLISGVELALIRAEQIMVLVKEKGQRPKFAISPSVEVLQFNGKIWVNSLDEHDDSD